MAEFKASAHSGSTSPLKMIQVVESPADVTALERTPSFHSLFENKYLYNVCVYNYFIYCALYLNIHRVRGLTYPNNLLFGIAPG